jgi:hypothetical protein
MKQSLEDPILLVLDREHENGRRECISRLNFAVVSHKGLPLSGMIIIMEQHARKRLLLAAAEPNHKFFNLRDEIGSSQKETSQARLVL